MSCACTLRHLSQSFIPFCFLWFPKLFSVILLCCHPYFVVLFRAAPEKRWHWISVPWRWWPCLRRQLVSLSSMSMRIYAKDQRYVYTHFKQPLQVNHFNSTSYDPSLCYCRICGRGLSMMKLLIMFVFLILPCFHWHLPWLPSLICITPRIDHKLCACFNFLIVCLGYHQH